MFGLAHHCWVFVKKGMWCSIMYSEPCNCTLAYRMLLALRLLSLANGVVIVGNYQKDCMLTALKAVGFAHTL